MTAGMDQLDLVSADKALRLMHAIGYIKHCSGQRRRLVIAQPVPFDAVFRQLFPQLSAPGWAGWTKRYSSFETQQSESRAALAQLAQVGNHLALAQWVAH